MLHIKDDAQDTVPMHPFPPARYKAVGEPMKFAPIDYERHISDHHTDDEADKCTKGEGAGVLLVPLIIVVACLSAAALWHLVATGLL